MTMWGGGGWGGWNHPLPLSGCRRKGVGRGETGRHVLISLTSAQHPFSLSFAYLPFCRTTSLDKKLIYKIRILSQSGEVGLAALLASLLLLGSQVPGASPPWSLQLLPRIMGGLPFAIPVQRAPARAGPFSSWRQVGARPQSPFGSLDLS
jgi:hypothetical protein